MGEFGTWTGARAGEPANFLPSAIVDGTPQADGTTWYHDTAFWMGLDGTVTINLAGSFAISSLTLQADDNDSYKVAYWNGSAWTDIQTFGTAGSWGLVTRPTLNFGSPITTDAFQITATGGDGWYSVGQFSADGVAAVPEPETYAMMLAGLSLLGAIARRRKA
jgi:hypothetical protein